MEEEKSAMESNVQEQYIDDNLCKVCTQSKIDKSENENYVICEECREKMIRYPIPKIFLFFSIIIVVLIGISFFHFPKLISDYRIYENSTNQADNGDIDLTIENFYSLTEQYPESIPIAVRFTDLAMDFGYYDIASDVLSTYLMEKEMDIETVDRLNIYIDKLNRYYNSIESIEKIQNELSEQEAFSEGYNRIKILLDDSTQDKAVVYYYLAAYTSDIEETKLYLEKCINEDKNFLDAKARLATILRREGDLEKSANYYKEVLNVDKNYIEALRGLAVIKLLEDKKEEGLDLAYKAFDREPEAIYVWETYVIALKENGKNSDVENEIQNYIAEGNIVDLDTQLYLDGKTSLHDYYVGE